MRKAKTLICCGKEDEAVNLLETLTDLPESKELMAEARLRQEERKGKYNIDLIVKEYRKRKDKYSLEVNNYVNPNIKLEIDQRKGRKVIATSSITRGTLLLVENFYSSNIPTEDLLIDHVFTYISKPNDIPIMRNTQKRLLNEGRARASLLLSLYDGANGTLPASME